MHWNDTGADSNCPQKYDKEEMRRMEVSKHILNRGSGLEQAQIMSVESLLSVNLSIPDYQRPYKWNIKNITDLLTDVENAINEGEKYNAFRYRVGTIILHFNTKTNSFDIVDGQQRCITFLLLKLFLKPDMSDCSLLNTNYTHPDSQSNIHANYLFIRDWFAVKKDSDKERFLEAFSKLLEVVVLVVPKESEAFQLFDSQNTRGRELDPHDLLKAYHLREMRNYPYDMQRAVTKWEAIKPIEIKELFSKYLFPIMNWTHHQKSRAFTSNEIDVYKGISEASPYSYASRAKKAMPAFQISESFIAGSDFFEMVEYYLYLLKFVQEEVYKYIFLDEGIKRILDQSKSVGFCYAKQLFECAVFCYYDRFRNFDLQVVKKLFTWAFMIRVDMENLQFDTINSYALGINDNSNYSNSIPMFSIINSARLHTEVASVPVTVLRIPDEARNKKKWYYLYTALKRINGFEEV